jgi:hypothetical protein
MGLRDVLRETARVMGFLGFVLSGDALVEFGMCIVSVLLLHYMFCNTTSRGGDTGCTETLNIRGEITCYDMRLVATENLELYSAGYYNLGSISMPNKVHLADSLD